MLSGLRMIWRHPITRRRRLAAVANYVRLQVRLRLSGRSVVPFTDRAKLRAERAMPQTLGCAYVGLLDYADMLFVLRFLRPDDLFVDVGANVGLYSVLAAADADARVLCVEPVPAAFARLTDNLALNRLTDRVTAVNVGIGRADGELEFAVAAGDGHTSHALAAGEAPPPDGVVRCPVRRLDDLLAGRVPVLMKVDVEGFESEVLAGGSATFASPALQAVLIELNGLAGRYGRSDRAVHDALVGYGFAPFAYHPDGNRLDPLTGPDHANNVLYLRDPTAVLERVRTARPVRVFGVDV